MMAKETGHYVDYELFDEINDLIRDHERLQRENEQLQIDLQKMVNEIDELVALKADNKRLRELLDYSCKHICRWQAVVYQWEICPTCPVREMLEGSDE